MSQLFEKIFCYDFLFQHGSKVFLQESDAFSHSSFVLCEYITNIAVFSMNYGQNSSAYL